MYCFDIWKYMSMKIMVTAWANILPIELHTHMQTDILQVILGMLIYLVEE